MFETQNDLVGELRSMARRGDKPSDMLRILIVSLDLETIDGLVEQNILVQHFVEAFCFFDCEAYPIFGWFPNGSGELKDANIDMLLSTRIQKTKCEWDRA